MTETEKNEDSSDTQLSTSTSTARIRTRTNELQKSNIAHEPARSATQAPNSTKKTIKNKRPNKTGTRRSSLTTNKKEKKDKRIIEGLGIRPGDNPSNQPRPCFSKVESSVLDHDLDEDDEQNESAVTRCICGEDNEEANDVIMFQCDKCSVWQHGPCVGLYAEFPGDYFCELCRPDLHTTGQYLKSSPSPATHPKRSPSLTSAPATTNRRERVNTDAASLAAFLTDAGVKPEDQVSIGGFALPIFAQTRRQSNMLVDGSVSAITSPTATTTALKKGPHHKTVTPGAGNVQDQSENQTHKNTKRSSNSDGSRDRSPSLPNDSAPVVHAEVSSSLMDHYPSEENPHHHSKDIPHPKTKRKRQIEEAEELPVKTQHSGPATKNKRTRKNDDTDEPMKIKAQNAFSHRASSTIPAPQAGAAHKRGSPMKQTKEDTKKTKTTEAREMTPLDGGGWGLPDHLGYLSYLLPTPSPAPISVSNIRPLGEMSVPNSATFPPEDMMSGTPRKGGIISTGTQLEPATRVKFPGKRVTIADLRKRSKHLVDYLQKVQIETSEREKRSELIQKASSSSSSFVRNVDDEDQKVLTASITMPVVSSQTLEIMDDLTRELYHWQEKYKQN